MLRLDLKETDDWLPVTLTGAQANLLATSEVVDIRPGTTRRWEVRARSKVGAVIIGPPDEPRLNIRIAPKVPIGRLLFLIGYATSGISWQPDGVELPEAPDLPSGIAEALVRVTDRALDHGHLVHAKGNEHSHTHKLPGVTVHAHTLDLDTEPAALLAQVADLPSRIGPHG